MKQIQDVKLITAIKTPYLPNGELDLECYDRLVERQIENGVQGLVIAGTTGEGHLMNWDEHIMLIAHTACRYSDDLVIIGNTGSNNTREAYRATQHGFAVGMDYSLQINPYYGKTSEAGLFAHFNKVLDIGPAIIYNVPPRTNQDITPEVMMKLAEHQNMAGIKECMGSERIEHYESKGIFCWSGNDDQCHDSKHLHKAHGVVSVTSNLIPRTMRRLLDRKDDSLNQDLQELFSWMFCAPNPIPLNTIMSMAGLIKPVFRLPYVPLSKEIREKGKRLIEKLGLVEELGEIRVMEDDDFSCV